jgi:hypothetical protein
MAFFAGTIAGGIVYNGILFVSYCTRQLVNTTELVAGLLGAGRVFQVVRIVTEPVIDKSLQLAAMGTSVIVGSAVGMTVYAVQSMRKERGEKMIDFGKVDEWCVISE